MNEPGFEIVPASERPKRRIAERGPSPLSLALAAGHTVWVAKPFNSGRVRQPTGYCERLGLRVRQVSGDRDGVPGLYLWAEKR